MPSSNQDAAQPLRESIESIEKHLRSLKDQLATIEVECESTTNGDSCQGEIGQRPLDLEEYQRYGRQMIIPGFGLQGRLVESPHVEA